MILQPGECVSKQVIHSVCKVDSNLRGEVCRCSGSRVGIGRESSLVHSAFVFHESSDPVASNSISKHGIVVCSLISRAACDDPRFLPLQAEIR
jgi:hypothetical protein